MRVRDEQQEFGNPGRGVMLVSLPLSLQTKCQHPPEPFLFQAGTVASTLPRLPPPFFFFLPVILIPSILLALGSLGILSSSLQMREMTIF